MFIFQVKVHGHKVPIMAEDIPNCTLQVLKEFDTLFFDILSWEKVNEYK